MSGRVHVSSTCPRVSLDASQAYVSTCPAPLRGRGLDTSPSLVMAGGEGPWSLPAVARSPRPEVLSRAAAAGRVSERAGDAAARSARTGALAALNNCAVVEHDRGARPPSRHDMTVRELKGRTAKVNRQYRGGRARFEHGRPRATGGPVDHRRAELPRRGAIPRVPSRDAADESQRGCCATLRHPLRRSDSIARKACFVGVRARSGRGTYPPAVDRPREETMSRYHLIAPIRFPAPSVRDDGEPLTPHDPEAAHRVATSPRALAVARAARARRVRARRRAGGSR